MHTSRPRQGHLARPFYSLSGSISESGLEDAVEEMINETQCDPSTFVMTLIYLERAGMVHKKLKVNFANVIRLLHAALWTAIQENDVPHKGLGFYADKWYVGMMEARRLSVRFAKVLDSVQVSYAAMADKLDDLRAHL